MVYNNPLIWETEAKEEYREKLAEAEATRLSQTAMTVVGLFEKPVDAQLAYHNLEGVGFTAEQMSIAAREEALVKQTAAEANQQVVGETAGMVAVGGSMIGGFAGLLASGGVLLIPGIGPILAAGTLAGTIATTLIGAGLGAATGGLVGTLIGLGITKGDAEVYAQGIEQGGVLLIVHTDRDHAQTALDIMHQAKAINLETRSEAG
jgi:hypothetical protein